VQENNKAEGFVVTNSQRKTIAVIPGALVLCALVLIGQTTTWASTTQGLYSFDIVASTGGPADGLSSSPTGLGAPSINANGTVAFPCTDTAGSTVCIGSPGGPGIAFRAGPLESPNVFLPGIAIDNNGLVSYTKRANGPFFFLETYNALTNAFVSLVANGHFETCPGLNCLNESYDGVFGDVAANTSGQVVFGALDRHVLFSNISNCTQTACLVTPTNSLVAATAFNELPIISPIRPAIADDGTVVVRFQGTTLIPPIQATTTTKAIQTYNYTLSTPTTMADEAASWVLGSLGLSPGISRDAVAVGFIGDRGAGQGVFVSIKQTDGSQHLVRVAGEGKPDLNLSSASGSTPITFISFDGSSRVAIVHKGLGNTGLMGDVFVVSFVGTPSTSSPSGSNSAFTAQQGLWTARVHVLTPQVVGGPIVYQVDAKEKVIQEGDHVPGTAADTVDVSTAGAPSTIQVYDPIVQRPLIGNSTDKNLALHQVAFVTTSGSGVKQYVMRATSGCGDVRDQMIAEYQQAYSITKNGNTHQSTPDFAPSCANFTQSAGSSLFDFSELNSGDYTWALIRSPIVSGRLDAWINELGSGPARSINSGYRNPVHNFGPAKSVAASSRHMHGDAIDLQNISRTPAEYQQLAEAAFKTFITAKEGYIEPQNGPCGLACVHADWRNVDPDQYAP
jgi:Peptidase M15